VLEEILEAIAMEDRQNGVDDEQGQARKHHAEKPSVERKASRGAVLRNRVAHARKLGKNVLGPYSLMVIIEIAQAPGGLPRQLAEPARRLVPA
jgi:hypothetical protein